MAIYKITWQEQEKEKEGLQLSTLKSSRIPLGIFNPKLMGSSSIFCYLGRN